MNTDERFMKEALALGDAALKLGFLPVGAVVVSGDTIIGRGHKTLASDPAFRHAEVEALRQALGRGRPAGPLALYSTLEPCIMCFGTALHTFVRRVVFALEDPGGGATGIDLTTLPVRHRGHLPQVVGGVLRQEAIGQMRQFLAATANPYWNNPKEPLVALINRAPPSREDQSAEVRNMVPKASD